MIDISQKEYDDIMSVVIKYMHIMFEFGEDGNLPKALLKIEELKTYLKTHKFRILK